METRLLKDPAVFPSEAVLKNALGRCYAAYAELNNTLTDSGYGFTFNWNYYNDGKSWLCKVSLKKKTVFWLSVWEKHFKTGFYFTEKTFKGLNIPEPLNRTGKSIPVVITVAAKKDIKDVLKITDYKLSVI